MKKILSNKHQMYTCIYVSTQSRNAILFRVQTSHVRLSLWSMECVCLFFFFSFSVCVCVLFVLSCSPSVSVYKTIILYLKASVKCLVCGRPQENIPHTQFFLTLFIFTPSAATQFLLEIYRFPLNPFVSVACLPCGFAIAAVNHWSDLISPCCLR